MYQKDNALRLRVDVVHSETWTQVWQRIHKLPMDTSQAFARVLVFPLPDNSFQLMFVWEHCCCDAGSFSYVNKQFLKHILTGSMKEQRVFGITQSMESATFECLGYFRLFVGGVRFTFELIKRVFVFPFDSFPIETTFTTHEQATLNSQAWRRYVYDVCVCIYEDFSLIDLSVIRDVF